MKKILLSIFALCAGVTANAQAVYSYGFDGTTADLTTAGWVRTNQSTPTSTTLWSVASYSAVTVSASQSPLPFTDTATPTGQVSNPPNGQAGGANSFALVNFTSTTGAGTISNWLISPTVTVENGDVVSFYTRIGKNSATAASFADNLELRMSTTGAASTNPSLGASSLGSFTDLLVEVNPAQNLSSYPMSWATGMKSAVISGLTGPTAVKFAFRYFVTNGGPSGANSDIIGIDTFLVDRPLSTENFFKSNFAMYPNPAKNVLNITAKAGFSMENVVITDLNGRVVKQQNLGGVSASELNVSDLTSGMYLVTISSADGKGTSKFMKN